LLGRSLTPMYHMHTYVRSLGRALHMGTTCTNGFAKRGLEPEG